MAKYPPKVPAAIQARLSQLRRRRSALLNLIEALEQYVQCLAMEPTSIAEGSSRAGSHVASVLKTALAKRKAA